MDKEVKDEHHLNELIEEILINATFANLPNNAQLLQRIKLIFREFSNCLQDYLDFEVKQPAIIGEQINKSAF